MKYARLLGFALAIGLLFIGFLLTRVSNRLPPENTVQSTKNIREKALTICGLQCPSAELDLTVQFLIERPDGVVVLKIPYRTPTLLVIDTKLGAITDATASWPYFQIGNVIVTSGEAQDLSYLRVLTVGKTKFETLSGSELGDGQTYDSGETYDVQPEWNVATTTNGFSIATYQLSPAAPPFKNVGKRTFTLSQ